MAQRHPDLVLPEALDKDSLRWKIKNLKDSSRNTRHTWFAQVLPAMEASSIAANPVKTNRDLRELGKAMADAACDDNAASSVKPLTMADLEERGRQGVLQAKSAAAEALLLASFSGGADVDAASSAAAADWLAQHAPGFDTTRSGLNTSGKAAAQPPPPTSMMLHHGEVNNPGLRETCLVLASSPENRVWGFLIVVLQIRLEFSWVSSLFIRLCVNTPLWQRMTPCLQHDDPSCIKDTSSSAVFLLPGSRPGR